MGKNDRLRSNPWFISGQRYQSYLAMGGPQWLDLTIRKEASYDGVYSHGCGVVDCLLSLQITSASSFCFELLWHLLSQSRKYGNDVACFAKKQNHQSSQDSSSLRVESTSSPVTKSYAAAPCQI
ncbi:hypothetical protein DY000_02053444 [Brassica cretica]|uniref:Uncharacterized protein n=1 Tax=Brassica cretica TaxID=69181 RepID=A0ABQ7A763_BRACR|nr:hypothetical protein DY000_02053444 [Brassica cretica]